MSRIPEPQRGQPLDLGYIAQIVRAVNDLSVQTSASINKYVTVETPTAGKQSAKTSETRMIGGYKEVVNASTITAGNETAFYYDFPSADFKYPPIVTVSPINISGTAAGNAATVTLKTVTTSRVEGVVKFNSSGTVSVGVNIIAIGIPN